MTQVLSVAVDQLMADPTQPRKIFEADALNRMADSITARGVLVPLKVHRDEERRCWLIVMGETRWRAAKIAGLSHVPCIEADGRPEEADILADRIIENECRNDLTAMEFGKALVRLKSLKGVNSVALAKELGLSPSAITRAEALLSLPADIQAMVDSGLVPESAGYSLSRLSDEAAQRTLAHALAEGRMTRDQVAADVKQRLAKPNPKPKGDRLLFKLGGMTAAVSSRQTMTWKELLPVLEKLYSEGKRLSDANKSIAELAKALTKP